LGLFVYAHDTCVLQPLDGEGFNTHSRRSASESNSSVNNTPAEKIDWKGSAFEQNQYNKERARPNNNSAAALLAVKNSDLHSGISLFFSLSLLAVANCWARLLAQPRALRKQKRDSCFFFAHSPKIFSSFRCERKCYPAIFAMYIFRAAKISFSAALFCCA